MALNKLILSWNFDNITSSIAADNFEVKDTINNYSAVGVNFQNSIDNGSTIIEKEDVKTNKKLHFETLESIDTIQILDQDDEKVSYLQKPQGIKLLVENSMYQIMSDDMLSMFADIGTLAFNFTQPSHKFDYSYTNLKNLKDQFFSKVENNPDLERYVEFYKWLDSSLGHMIDQLKPVSAESDSGLKVTVESHVLERNKYKYITPTTFKRNKVFETPAVSVYRHGSSLTEPLNSGSYNLSGNVSGVIAATENILDQNYSENYEVVQTAGRYVNNRGSKPNKTVIQTRFSAGDGLSEADRDSSGEYSVYNNLNRRASNIRSIYNEQQAASGNINQGTGSSFNDNYFVQRNIPHTSSRYSNTGNIPYQAIPNESIMNYRRNNYLFGGQSILKEPVIEVNPPVYHKLKINGALENIETYSPFSTLIDTFTQETLNSTGAISEVYNGQYVSRIANLDRPAQNLGISPEETFFLKANNLSSSIKILEYERLENIFPPKYLMGIGRGKTKLNYEEVEGTYSYSQITWSQNSYNNNTARIRTFWDETEEKRKRYRESSNFGGYAKRAINCLDDYSIQGVGGDFDLLLMPNTFNFYISPLVLTAIRVKAFNKTYFSKYALDSNNKTYYSSSSDYFEYGGSDINPIELNFRNEIVGDLSPFSDWEAAKFTGFNSIFYIYPTAKPAFTHNIYSAIEFTGQGSLENGFIYNFYINTSYQNGVDKAIVPAYSTHKKFLENIKVKTRDYNFLPEFMVSNFSKIAVSEQFQNNYLKMLGRENFKDENFVEKDYEFKSTKFYNKKTNKFKIKIKGIKKLLPYNGFYPREFSLNIIDEFNQTYCTFNRDNYQEFTSYERQALIQPFFAPGVFFNTIKAGIAMEYNVPITSSNAVIDEIEDIYTRDGQYSISENLTLFSNYRAKENLPYKKVSLNDLLNPELFFKKYEGSSSVYLDPTHYNPVFGSGSLLERWYTTRVFPTASFKNINRMFKESEYNNDKKYKLKINNFLAETVNFFLKDQKLTSFVSKPEKNFLPVSAGSVYKLNIEINKNDNFSMFQLAPNFFSASADSLFGPPVRNSTYDGGVWGFNDLTYSSSSYIKYTPAYFNNVDGRNKIEISYTPTTSGVPTLQDIFNESKFSLISGIDPTNSDLEDNLLYKNILPETITTFDSITGAPLTTLKNNENNRWVIQTKFECPLINYTASANVSSSTFYFDSVAGYGSVYTRQTGNIIYNSVDGIWSAYGSVPEDGESVQIKISGPNTGSLLDICGFQQEIKSISVLAESKEISEGIMLIPYITPQVSIGDRIPNGFMQINNELKDANGNFKLQFKISKQKISKLLNVQDYTKVGGIKNIKKILETSPNIDNENSLVKIMKSMLEYNIPPHFNWLKDYDIEPFLFYIVDCKHTLTKQDLADIWQGTMPSIAKTPEEFSVEYEHNFEKDDFYDNVDIASYSDKIKFKIFKIKKRANQNYADLTANIEDNQKYDQIFRDRWYSYNWPYDYFSLVELVNVQAGEAYDSALDVTGSA